MPVASRGLWLITSGAYVSQELAAEFGQLPPSFLPLGTRRLYEYHLELTGHGTPVYLTLPEGFEIPDEDRRRLEFLGATPLLVPEGLTLGESVLFALNLIGGADQPVRILHGDTLVDKCLPDELDRIGVATSSEGYSWAVVKLDGDRIADMQTVEAGASNDASVPIACGYFAFSRSMALVRSLTRARGKFVEGILDYAKSHPLFSTRINSWYDFGHVQTFFRSRRIMTSARHFNDMRIDGRTARKSSEDVAKIRAEANWLENVPSSLRIFTARLIDAGNQDDGRAFYETEYGYLPTLSELFVYGRLGTSAWGEILNSCRDFLTASTKARTASPADALLRELTSAKTAARLQQFTDQTGFNIGRMLHYGATPLPSLTQIAEDVVQHIDFSSGRRACVMHGDFCFSNILYDSRMRRIRVIDPRGYVAANQPSTAGDIRYDLAKFAHSIVGRYDQIICGRYRLAAPDDTHFFLECEQAPHHAWLERQLRDFTVDGLSAGGKEVRAICVCLFLSMLPLHSDKPERQRAFIANALRLYATLESNTL